MGRGGVVEGDTPLVQKCNPFNCTNAIMLCMCLIWELISLCYVPQFSRNTVTIFRLYEAMFMLLQCNYNLLIVFFPS